MAIETSRKIFHVRAVLVRATVCRKIETGVMLLVRCCKGRIGCKVNFAIVTWCFSTPQAIKACIFVSARHVFAVFLLFAPMCGMTAMDAPSGTSVLRYFASYTQYHSNPHARRRPGHGAGAHLICI